MPSDAAMRFAVAAAALLTLAAPAFSAAAISGRITADGKPLAGAWVQLNTGLLVATDARGRYALPPVPKATYAVQALAPGKEPAVLGGVVAGQDDADLDLKPSPTPWGLLHLKAVRADRGEPCPVRVVTRWRATDRAEFGAPRGLAFASTLDGRGQPLVPAESAWRRIAPRGACLWTQGEAVLALPPGQAELTCTSGPLLSASQQTVEVKAAEVAEVSVVMVVGVDLGALGWAGGVAGCRVSSGEGGYLVNLPLAAAVCRAEGMAWVGLSPGSGGDPAQGDPARTAQELSNEGFQVGPAVESPPTAGGRTITFGPANADFPSGTAPHHYEAAALKRGLALYARALDPETLARGLPLDLLVDPLSVPALDLQPGAPNAADYFRLYALLLNHGYRIGAAACDDGCFSQGVFPPAARTFAQVESDRSLTGVAAGLRRGATLVTTGPVVTFTVGDVSPGQSVPADDQLRIAEIDAWFGCVPGAALARVELLRGGTPVKTWTAPAATPNRVQVRLAVRERTATWYAVRAYGQAAGDAPPPPPVALTSPVYFVAAGASGAAPLEAHLKGRVHEQAGGAPISGARVTATPPWGRPASATTDANGGYALVAPAASMVEVTHPRYQRVTASAPGDPAARRGATAKFLAWDCLAAQELMRSASSADLLDWSYYERLREALANAELDFPLRVR